MVLSQPQQPVIHLLAQTKSDLDGVRRDGLVPVEGPQRFHAVGLTAQPLIAIPNNRRHQLLTARVFVARFQRLVARTPEIQYRVVDRRRLCACNWTTVVSNNFRKTNFRLVEHARNRRNRKSNVVRGNGKTFYKLPDISWRLLASSYEKRCFSKHGGIP